MIRTARWSAPLILVVAALYGAPASAESAPSPAPAATTAPSPSPSPAATAAAVSDPCTSTMAIVNRPTIGTGVCTVRPNHIMVETGYTNTVTSGGNGTASISYPQTFIRIGMKVPQLELEFTPPTYLRSGTVSGASDIAFGAKYELGYTARALYGVNATVTAATGDTAVSSGGTSYTGNFNYGYTLSPVFSLAGSLGFNSFAAGLDVHNNLQRYSAFIPTLELAMTLPASTQLFAEGAYFSHAGFNQPSRTYYDFGVQKDLWPRFQIDAEYGFSPTVILGQKQHYLGAGMAYSL